MFFPNEFLGFLDNVIIVFGFYKTINKQAVKSAIIVGMVISVLRLAFVVTNEFILSTNQLIVTKISLPNPYPFLV